MEDTIYYKGYKIEIVPDEFADDPLKWQTPDERGVWFLLEHNRYDLPFELDMDLDNFDSWTALAKATKKPYKFVRWYEHSGIAVSLRDDEHSGAGWDAGCAGVIIGETTEQIEQEFDNWRRYIEGDVWDVRIYDPSGEWVDGNGDNFDDYDNLVDMAKASIDRMTADNIKMIERLERINGSVNGNPRYRVHFTDGTSAKTKSDASLGYSIGNPNYRNVWLDVSYTKAGNIEDIKILPEGEA